MNSTGNNGKRGKKTGLTAEEKTMQLMAEVGTNALLEELINLCRQLVGPLGVVSPLALSRLPIELKDQDDRLHLSLNLLFYDECIIAQRYDKKGVPQEPYLVDPAQIGTSLAGLSLLGTGLLPENVLFWGMLEGHPRLGIYIPANRWTVAIKSRQQALKIPLPPLVFIGHRYDYSLWAVEGRPTNENAQIYMAPCPNTSVAGVCRGNAPFPSAAPATIWPAWEVFITSRFNDDLGEQKSKAYPRQIIDQWLALDEEGAEEYPMDDLVRVTNLTLGGLIKNVSISTNVAVR